MTSDTSTYQFRLWRPSAWDYVRRFLLSESFAWAVQNGMGVFFTVLFAVVVKMQFTLGCVSACLYAAASQVLSLDRTVGGRLFGGVIFIGCMLSSGLVGGIVSTLAWLAGGNPEGLIQYLPDNLQEVPTRYDLGLILEYLPKVASLVLPEPVRIAVQDIVVAIESQIPAVNDSFWILLMIFFIIVSLPFCVARACGDLQSGTLMAVATLFMGSQVVFASLMPIFGLKLYWTQVPVGYIKVALVSAGAMIITGTFLLARSAHDDVRLKLSAVLQGVGCVLSISGSRAVKCSTEEGHSLLSKSSQSLLSDNNSIRKDKECDDRTFKVRPTSKEKNNFSEQEYAKKLREEVLILSSTTSKYTDDCSSRNSRSHKYEYSTGEDALEAGIPRSMEMPIHHTSLQLLAAAEAIEGSLASMMFEPPLPGIESCALPVSDELNQSNEKKAVENLRSSFASIFASCAAICADAATALAHMPMGKPCSGPEIHWRPRDISFYNEMENTLKSCENDLEVVLADLDSQMQTPVGFLPLGSVALAQGRATLLMLNSCEVLISQTQKVEIRTAIALDLSKEVSIGIVEDAKGFHAERKTVKEKLARSAYLPVVVLAITAMGLPVWLEAKKSFSHMYRWIRKMFGSATARAQAVRDRDLHFALKYWLGLSITIVGIILILWKDKGSSDLAPQAAFDIAYFFFIWQPVYFWITAAICIQKQVESSVFRAALRALITLIGGVLGYATMLNGRLSNNPYFISGMTVAFSAALSLLSPVKELRYSLFLAIFTYNALVVCQYWGSCCFAGETKVFGGKVLSTTLGSIYSVFVSWCFAPYYTSDVMFDQVSSALQKGVLLIKEMKENIDRSVLQPREGSPETQEELKKEQSARDWLLAVNEAVRVPLGRVRKEVEMNTLDKKQLPVTWLILPTPPVIKLLSERLNMLTVYLQGSAILTDSRLVSGNVHLYVPEEFWRGISPLLDDLLTLTKRAADNCRECMTATTATEVHRTREVVREGIDKLIYKSLAFKSKADDLAKEQTVQGQMKWSPENFKFGAWIYTVLLVTREVEVIGMILSETEVALDRDYYFAWLSSWFGRRPLV